jgi:hypothetical protein
MKKLRADVTQRMPATARHFKSFVFLFAVQKYKRLKYEGLYFVDLYGCETWHGLMMFGLRKVVRPKRDEVMELGEITLQGAL